MGYHALICYFQYKRQNAPMLQNSMLDTTRQLLFANSLVFAGWAGLTAYSILNDKDGIFKPTLWIHATLLSCTSVASLFMSRIWDMNY
jgi:hypothetical protein